VTGPHDERQAAARSRVLIAEDDSQLRDLLDRLLTEVGYDVDAVGNAQVALHRALTRTYHVLVIDRGLPDFDGLDLVRRLRTRAVYTPVLILTAYGALADRVAGLDAGAEDYMVKPFEVDELLARLRALLRREQRHAGRLSISGVMVDLVSRVAVRADGTEVELSGREAALLRTLAAGPRRVYSRAELRAHAFHDATSDSIVDTYVHYLRRKLGTDIIKTVRGLGYRVGSR
jgi:two-component system, OmpR family, response regulator QseB